MPVVFVGRGGALPKPVAAVRELASRSQPNGLNWHGGWPSWGAGGRESAALDRGGYAGINA